MALLGAFAAGVVRAQPNGGMHHPSSRVRMSVDPTVLPPVENPDKPAVPLEEESVSVTPFEKAEPAEAEPATVVPLAPEKKTAAPAAEVIPAPQSGPVPSSAPVSAPVSSAEAVPAPKPAPQGKGVINKITLESTNSRFVVTVHCDRPVGDTSYLNLSNPRRFVIDLRQPWGYEAANVIRTSSGKVDYVVTGAHPDRFRLVVHFRTPPKGKLEPVMQRNGNSIVISVPLQ